MLEIDELRDDDVAAAAELLSLCHTGVAEWAGAESVLADVQTAQRTIASCLSDVLSVAARMDGQLAGFLVAPSPGSPRARTANVALAGHAAAPDVAREVYRAMYSAIAGRLMAAGCSRHQVGVLVAPDSVVATWFELGFGVDQIHGLRDLDAVSLPSNAGAATRPATTDDLAALTDLAAELITFHFGPPMFHRGRYLDASSANLDSLPDLGRAERDQLRRDLELSITTEASAVFVAEEPDRLLGFMQVQPDGRFLQTASIGQAVVTGTARSRGVGTALLATVVDWSIGQGFERCSVGWTSTNPISDPFWRSRGFRPVRYRLGREIDSWTTAGNEASDRLA